jgi:hypothetical protein
MELAVWDLPAPSREFMLGPQILISPGTVTLRWDFAGESGGYEWSSAQFAGVEAVRFTAHDSCTPEQVRPYDRVVEIQPSDLVPDLRAAGPRFLQHFRIYFDEAGCLDVVAEEFLPPLAARE